MQKSYQEFNELSVPVFGLHGVTHNGICECLDKDCKALFKHPKNSSWEHTPIWEDEQIEVMELTGAFDTGYGVLCNDLIVIDVDARNGGIESYTRLLNDFPSIGFCDYIVETGSGGGSKHLYFRKPKDCPPLKSHHNNYKGIDFKNSGYVVGAGSKHISGRYYKAVVGTPYDICDAPIELINLLEKEVIIKSDIEIELSNSQISEMMEYIPNNDDDYDHWIMVGMALNEAGADYLEWVRWSSRSPKHDEKQMLYKWNSFGKNPNRYSLGTLIYLAKENGYTLPLLENNQEFDSSIDWSKKPDIDLTKPPFLAGEIASWINKNSMYPRERLSTGVAIMVLSSVFGLNYRGLNNSSLNLFMFCVAGSGTGKEGISQKYASLLRGVGIQRAMHGNFISSQELTRNLIDHQASFYNIDEFGEQLSKLKKAQQRGGGHLESAIKDLMEIYTKANSYFYIANTHKKQFEELINKEIAQIHYRKKENESLPNDDILLEKLKERLNSLDSGIKEPFLNLIGYTTPQKFEDLMDLENSENGFFNRSIVIKEIEDNPRWKEDFKFIPLDEDLEYRYLVNKLSNYYYQGFTPVDKRIERLIDKPIELPCNDKNRALLNQIREDIYWLTEDQKEKQGFTAHLKRVYESILKVATLLSISEGEMQTEAILWAKEFIFADVELKLNITSANVNSKTMQGLESKILSQLDKSEGLSFANIRNKLRSNKKEDIEKAINKLLEQKLIKEFESNPIRGAKTLKYLKI